MNLERARLEADRFRDLLKRRPFDRAAWESACAPTLHLRLGNAPPATRRDLALDQLSAFMACTMGFGSGFCEVWRRREVMFAETDVTFLDLSGRHCALPCTIVARSMRGLLQDMRIHLDPSPIPGLVVPGPPIHG